ncbi:hypothetical protein CVS40_11997 [Lucilia cuprina]|nr:hypothetical protein CVS40_11997 [Lucilia cuprina]
MDFILCLAEAIVNRTPLTPLSKDPNDLGRFTPAHFLISRPLNNIMEPSTSNVNPASLKRYHIVRWILQEFWDR